MRFVWTKWHWGRVFYEYFGFPLQSVNQLLRAHHLSSGAGAMGQIVADVPSLTAPKEILKMGNMSPLIMLPKERKLETL
jgi:hypothetical protein